MSRLLLLMVLVSLPVNVLAQETAEIEIPDKAICPVCNLGGETHGMEKVKAHSIHEGKGYFFCNTGCKERFDADPVAYVTPTFPMPAPAFAVNAPDGATVDLASYEGQWLLLDFWATWCKPCVTLMPQLNELAETYAPRGLAVLGVSVDEDAKKAVEFAKKKKIGYPIATENPEAPAWQAFHVAVVPTAYLINPKGEVVARWLGDWDHDEVAAALETHLPKE